MVCGTAVLCEQTGRATVRVLASVPTCESVDSLGRTLDWLYAHDPTKVFAEIASRAWQVFGISASQVHVDTTSFFVSGSYDNADCDHWEDLKQWMLALAITNDGDVPLFLHPLDGKSSDKVSLFAAVLAIQQHLREAVAEPSVYVADNGIYSGANMRQLNAAGVKWVSRVSENLQPGENGLTRRQSGLAKGRGWRHRVVWSGHVPATGQRTAIVIVRPAASLKRAQASLQRQVSRAQASWERKCWHLGTRRFACEADARAALERELKGKPTWEEIHSDVVAPPRHAGKDIRAKRPVV